MAETRIDDVKISTVFLGLNQDLSKNQDTALFETVAFVNNAVHQMRRYFIWEVAEAGHAGMVSLIRAEMETVRTSAAAAWAKLVKRWFSRPNTGEA